MSLPYDFKALIQTRFPNSEVVFSSWFLAGRNSHNLAEEKLSITIPYIIIYNDAEKNKSIQQNVNVLSDTFIQIEILAKDGDDKSANSEQSQLILDALEPLADNIIGILYRENVVRLQGTEDFKYKLKPVFKKYESILTGWKIEIRAKENQIISFCKTPPTP